MTAQKLSKSIMLSMEEAAKKPANRLHVIARNGKWVIKKDGAKRASGIYNTQRQAIEIATAQVKAGKIEEAIVHDLFGHLFQKIV